jgi:hypothetical protein
MDGTGNMPGLESSLSQGFHQAEVVLAVQLLLQLLVIEGSHIVLLSRDSRSHCASVAPAS